MTLVADSPLVTRLHPSPNFEPRRNSLKPEILLLHYTGLETVSESIDILSRPDCKVSCHYVISELGEIVQMVEEDMRAWHAGVACWAGQSDINSLSIGIEIHNPGHENGYPLFPSAQMQAVTQLSQDILARHNIAAPLVLGHSDVAPSRKRDPGEKFDWASLHRAGVGLWVAPAPVELPGDVLCPGQCGPRVVEAQRQLAAYGYSIAMDGTYDERMELVVTAFQRHFRPARCDGVFDASTRDTLIRLLAARDVAGSS